MYKVVFKWHTNFHTQGQTHTPSLAHTTHTLALSGNTAVDDGRTGQQHELSEGERRLLDVPSLPTRDRRSSPAVPPSSSVYSSTNAVSRVLPWHSHPRLCPLLHRLFSPLTLHSRSSHSLSYALCCLTFYFTTLTIIHTPTHVFSVSLWGLPLIYYLASKLKPSAFNDNVAGKGENCLKCSHIPKTSSVF